MCTPTNPNLTYFIPFTAGSTQLHNQQPHFPARRPSRVYALTPPLTPTPPTPMPKPKPTPTLILSHQLLTTIPLPNLHLLHQPPTRPTQNSIPNGKNQISNVPKVIYRDTSAGSRLLPKLFPPLLLLPPRPRHP